MEAKHRSELDSDEVKEIEVPEKKNKFSVVMGQEEVKNACINLVTAAKVPLAVLDSDGFKTLTAQIFSGLDMPTITSRNVMQIVDEKYMQIKNELIEALKDKIVCLKMDTATRCNRGILGVNVQYIEKGAIHIKTLAVIELKKSHTSHKKYLLNVTTDNGRNMIKAVELLNCGEADSSDEEIQEDADVLDGESFLSGIRIHTVQSVKCAAHMYITARCKGFSTTA